MQGYSSSAVGKRKTSKARVYLKEGEGKILVNGRDYKDYFGRQTLLMVIRQPLAILGKEKDFDILINVNGGGKSGQAGACRHGIARALNSLDQESNRPSLKQAGYLTRDSREVERKKCGHHKARKKPQYSKR